MLSPDIFGAVVSTEPFARTTYIQQWYRTYVPGIKSRRHISTRIVCSFLCVWAMEVKSNTLDWVGEDANKEGGHRPKDEEQFYYQGI